MIIREFLDKSQNPEINEQKEEVISLFMFMAQLPIETVMEDTESSSKLMFHVMSQLYQTNFFDEFLGLLINLKENNYINLHSSDGNKSSFRVYIRNRFIFKIVLCTSLKYKKKLFIQNNISGSNVFLQTLLRDILEMISIDRPQTLYLLKLIEMILKKREDILTPELSLLILKSMNKTASSPLTGFKHSAHNVSRIVVKSLSLDTKKYLRNFNNFPIKGIDLNDILRLFEETELRRFCRNINQRILKLFCNNTESRDGSFYYETLTNIYSFEEFTEHIWPHYSYYLEEFYEGEFYQSFLKYWIPITVNRYKDKFYIFIKNKKIDHQLKAYILLEIKKKGYYNKLQFDPDTLTFLKFSKTSVIGLKIICTYVKKNVPPDDFDIKCVQFYLNYYSGCEFPEEVLKCLKQFISQIFFVSHQMITKNFEDLNMYSQFLHFVYKFCFTSIVDAECCEISAQLLKIIWDIASGCSADLVTNYKIDRENVYESGNNLYYLTLKKTGFWEKTFTSDSLVNHIKNFLQQKLGHYPNFAKVVKERYLEGVNVDDFMNLNTLLRDINQSICLQSSEKIRLYTDLIIASKKLKCCSYQDDIIKLLDIFDCKIEESTDPQDLFCCVLILDIFLIFIINYDYMGTVSLLEKCLHFIEKVLDENTHSNLDIKATKVLESFINNVIECLMASENQWSIFHKKQILNQLCKIIQKSNMKRSVSMTINVVQCFGGLMEQSDEDREIKIKLLNRTLNSLYENKQNGKIRRNPETRLVIHALCLSDKNLAKPYLLWSLDFMLEVLSNPSSSDYTLSSTLHSLEVLVADNSIHQFTLPFIPKTIKHCVRLFNKTNWIIRNADLQLLKSLIERFLGVLLDYNVRPKTIEDLFVLFPCTVEYFYEILSVPHLSDSAVIVLLFFSESQIKSNSLIEKSLQENIDKFRRLFVHIIKNYSNNFGFLAIKAFTSLCSDGEIPRVYSEIVYYIQQNFLQMQTNVFANLIRLLRELYYKHKNSLVQTGSDVISCAMDGLVKYLKRFNCFYFNLLSLKLYTIEDLIKKIIVSFSTEVDYEKRIWLNNYLPHVIMEVDINQLGILLNQILLHRVPDFLQIKILSILADRLNNKCCVISEVINILILKLTKLHDGNKFLIMSYAKSILLFYEIAQELNIGDSLIVEIRQDFNTNCIYKNLIYVLVLAHVDNKTDQDKEFLNDCIEKYKESISDDEILPDLSSTVIHLYKSSSIHNRYDIMKLTFYLLLNNLTSFEMCKFISFLTKSQCSSVLISIAVLLKFVNLSSYVGDEQLAFKLLLEFYCYVDELPDEPEESDTYYLIENDFSLPKQYIKKIILKSLSDVTVC